MLAQTLPARAPPKSRSELSNAKLMRDAKRSRTINGVDRPSSGRLCVRRLASLATDSSWSRDDLRMAARPSSYLQRDLPPHPSFCANSICTPLLQCSRHVPRAIKAYANKCGSELCRNCVRSPRNRRQIPRFIDTRLGSRPPSGVPPASYGETQMTMTRTCNMRRRDTAVAATVPVCWRSPSSSAA